MNKIIDCYGINVHYSENTNGAGLELRHDCINAIQTFTHGRKFKRCYEWCSGPAFLGYSILGNNMCETLCLSDIFPLAITQSTQTAVENDLLDAVTIYQSDNWKNIPIDEKFDLIIANPPHFDVINYWNERWNYEQRIYLDKGWNIHKEFFAGVSQHLIEDGSIILLENAWGSGVNTFQKMIDDAGLKVVGHFLSEFKMDSIGRPIYYIHIKHS